MTFILFFKTHFHCKLLVSLANILTILILSFNVLLEQLLAPLWLYESSLDTVYWWCILKGVNFNDLFKWFTDTSGCCLHFWFISSIKSISMHWVQTNHSWVQNLSPLILLWGHDSSMEEECLFYALQFGLSHRAPAVTCR